MEPNKKYTAKALPWLGSLLLISILLALPHCLRQGAWVLSLISPQEKSYLDAPLVVLKDAAKASGAVCLDGSPAAFYFSEGSGEGAANWLINFEGGGWCISLENCRERAGTDLGSSKGWPATRRLSGHLSRDLEINPDLNTWNAAYLPYCDGASFSGNVSEPQTVGGKEVFFRGAAILDAILADLIKRGLRNAKQVVVTGCSAGGLAAYFHCDYIAAMLGVGISTKCMPDAGFFMDIPDIWGHRHWQHKYREAIVLHNLLGKVNEGCISAHPKEEAWKCFYAPYAAPFIKTPLFIVNPLFDTWQIAFILLGEPIETGAKHWAGCQYSFASCTAEQQKVLQSFADQVSATALSTISSADGDGAFLFACFMHCPNLDNDGWWNQITVDGTTLRVAAADWILGRGEDHFYVDRTTDFERGTNPSCRVSM